MKLTTKAFQKLHNVTTASLTSELINQGFQNTFIKGIHPLNKEKNMVGYAYTLRYVPSREDLDFEVDYDNHKNPQRIAIEDISEDEVLVIDSRGVLDAASLGHILCTRLKTKGAKGVVTDGALRDYPAIQKMDFPVYAGGAHGTTSSVKHHPVDYQLPIGCGEVMVCPGDVIVGDQEGVVVIPNKVAEEVAHKCYERDKLEDWILNKITEGDSIIGVYPPSEETLEEYKEYRSKVK